MGEYLDGHVFPDGIECEFNPTARGISVAADREGLRRVFVNVVDNAVQAMCNNEDGSEGTNVCGKVNITTRVTDEFFEISVVDNGPGIPEEVREKIFEPLFSTKSFGVGLGLPTVQKILERHGGGIEINNREAGGTEARIWLPLSDSETAERVA